MKNTYQNQISKWVVPAFLTALCLLSYGFFVPYLGFYWDDWAKILVYRLQGSAFYWPYYAGDRPLSAWTHIVLTPILGVSPIGWQIFTLSMRLVSAWGIFVLLCQLRPKAKFQSIMAASIFLVYPLFGQQPIAVTFHQQWMQFALIIWAFNTMLIALRDPTRKVLWIAISLLLSILQLSITEYFAPLELLRPFLIWFMLSPQEKSARKFGLVLKTWLPYLVLLSIFFVIRIFFMPFANDDPYRADVLFNFFTKPLETLKWVVQVFIVDISYIGFGSWSKVFESNIFFPLNMSSILFLAGSILIGLFAAIFLSKSPSVGSSEENDGDWSGMAVIIGLAGMLIGPIPAWITQRQVLFDFHSDRYALPTILGLSILTAGIINWLGRQRVQKAALAGLIIMLGSGYQLRIANEFRGVWDQEMRLYWQLFWRAPQLKAPTAIYSENELIDNQGLFSMSGALNQLYPQHDKDNELLDYWFYTLLPKFKGGAPSKIDISNDSQFRTLHFIGNSPNTLLIHSDPSHGNCLWILRSEDKENPYLSQLEKDMLPLSNLSRIESKPAQGFPPGELFGKEPEQGWCHSYEKAELAWQMEDWQTIVELGDKEIANGNTPLAGQSNSPREWWAFIEGYAHNNNVRKAIELSQQSIRQDKKYQPAICSLWRNMKDVPEMGVGLSELGCGEN